MNDLISKPMSAENLNRLVEGNRRSTNQLRKLVVGNPVSANEDAVEGRFSAEAQSLPV